MVGPVVEVDPIGPGNRPPQGSRLTIPDGAGIVGTWPLEFVPSCPQRPFQVVQTGYTGMIGPEDDKEAAENVSR